MESQVPYRREENLVPVYVEEKHKQLCASPSDIWEHLPVLATLASRYTSVIEAGVRTCVSTWSLSHGLLNLRRSGEEKLVLVSLDLQSHPNIERAKKILRGTLDFRFIVGSDLKYAPEGLVGLILVDTLHCGAMIFDELNHFAPWLQREVRDEKGEIVQYGGVFALHDTEVDRFRGEPVRCHFNLEVLMKETGYTREGLMEGMESGINRFLASPVGREFEVKKHYRNCNGLTIIGWKGEEFRDP